MFTLLVSWLLAVLVPGLLMLATLGLGRLEKALAEDSGTPTDVDEFVDNANTVDVHTLAREGMPEAVDYLHRRQAQRIVDPPPPGRHARPENARPPFAGDFELHDEPPLPTQTHRCSGANPEVSGARYVNRV